MKKYINFSIFFYFHSKTQLIYMHHMNMKIHTCQNKFSIKFTLIKYISLTQQLKKLERSRFIITSSWEFFFDYLFVLFHPQFLRKLFSFKKPFFSYQSYKSLGPTCKSVEGSQARLDWCAGGQLKATLQFE